MRPSPAGAAAVPGRACELACVAALCLLAAARILWYSAVFPPFDNEDEPAHYATVLEYAQGWPRSERLEPRTALDIAVFGSPEYVLLPQEAGGNAFVPFWRAPQDDLPPLREVARAILRQVNGEVMQPPLYYALAAAWRSLGERLGWEGGRAIFWLRFLNALFYITFMIIAYAAAVRFFPGRRDLALCVPLLLAALPQHVFYGINNDVLSPLTFAAALLAWFFAWECPDSSGRLALAGALTAACLLTKLTNAAILLAAAPVLVRVGRGCFEPGRRRQSLLALGAASAALGLPLLLWGAHNRAVFGDAWGTVLKARQMGWRAKPWSRVFHHPLFSASGAGLFFSELAVRFWRGECLWFDRPITTALDPFYAVSSPLLLVASLWPRRAPQPRARRLLRRVSAACVGGSVLLLVYWSVAYDFGPAGYYPSVEFPYVVSGRLITGALLPFFLLYVDGADRLLRALDLRRACLGFAVGLALCMSLSWWEAAAPIASSPFNFFHVPARVPPLDITGRWRFGPEAP